MTISREVHFFKKEINVTYNWDYLEGFSNIKLVKGDVRDFKELKELIKNVDVIIHTAAQTAVTTSLQDPKIDFETNVVGTFNILESARLSNNHPVVIYCSTNKVYGENVNKIKVKEKETRYIFENKFKKGIPETFSTDLCEHTPYGCSKLAGDLYVQDYGRLYGLRTGIFRMSCIYGTRQFGVEAQGWVAWFTIATILGKPITIYGNGKQVRDVLYVDDLVSTYDAFIKNDLPYGVFNMGGGAKNTVSLLELLELLQDLIGKRSKITFTDWRPSDQKVYISDISNAKEKLSWSPKVSPQEGIKKIVEWVEENKRIL